MNSTEICFLRVRQLGRMIRDKEISPVDVVTAHLRRIDSLEPELHSFITLLADASMAAARNAEKEIEEGKYRGPLHGIPIGLKDLYYTDGIRTTSGSKLFEGFIPGFDSTIAARFKEAGAILLGKLNMHPLAYGPTGENPDYGNMHNPWNPALIAGGSSGGSASAAAAGECPLTMGSDTGGSIRIPAALCGLVGFKPTYGRLSRYGLTPLAWSQDHAGPIGRTVEDCALALNATAGFDRNDPTSINLPVPDYTRAFTGRIRGLRIGVPKEYLEVPLDPQVKDSVWKAVDKLEELGAVISDVSWPMYHDAMPIAGAIQMVEAAACHSRLIRTLGPRIYPPVRLRLEAGFFISAADYVRAQQARGLFFKESLALMKEVDLLAGPTVAVTAFEIGKTKLNVNDTAVGTIALLTQYTRPFNLNGFPAVTVPCGFSDTGLPIGLQLAGRPLEEETVLMAAHAYEQSTDWHNRRPPI